jgi:hypothetical protein
LAAVARTRLLEVLMQVGHEGDHRYGGGAAAAAWPVVLEPELGAAQTIYRVLVEGSSERSTRTLELVGARSSRHDMETHAITMVQSWKRLTFGGEHPLVQDGLKAAIVTLRTGTNIGVETPINDGDDRQIQTRVGSDWSTWIAATARFDGWQGGPFIIPGELLAQKKPVEVTLVLRGLELPLSPLVLNIVGIEPYVAGREELLSGSH